MKTALFWTAGENKSVKCELCPRNCKISEGKRGFCLARKNISEQLYSLVYGNACSAAVDPIEKKPFYHFHPGSKVFSIAAYGCNLACDHCQNWQIARGDPEKMPSEDLPPEKVVELAVENNCEGIAYTYTEPTIFYEYALDTCKLAKKAGLFNVFVSNGMINREPLKKIASYLDAVNMDLKAFTDEFYKKYCHFPGGIEPIKQTARNCLEFGIHLEITTLVIPGHNDSEEELRNVAEFVKSLSPDVPLHFSRFFPHYKMSEVAPTPLKTLKLAEKIAREVGIKNVQLGNV
ncbi:MAG: AmmeMemoRadiSam system radical SAM enzyme [archaeon]